jgi:hypothetical protein
LISSNNPGKSFIIYELFDSLNYKDFDCKKINLENLIQQFKEKFFNGDQYSSVEEFFNFYCVEIKNYFEIFEINNNCENFYNGL